MTRSHFINGPVSGPDHSGAPWHLADDLRLLPRCGESVSVTARIPMIDLAAFSAAYRVCFISWYRADASEHPSSRFPAVPSLKTDSLQGSLCLVISSTGAK